MVKSNLGHSDDETVVSEIMKASSRLKILRIATLVCLGNHDPMGSCTDGLRSSGS